MSKILVASYRSNIAEHLRLALEYGGGLEIQAFSNPDVLESSWRALLKEYKPLLQDFPGPLALHGAFFDMASSSPDARIVALTRERYLLSLDIAAELGATHVVFHTNFLPMIRTEQYRRTWLAGQVEFWNDFGPEAAQRGIHIAIENMWDPDPLLLSDLCSGLDAPNVGVCLDVCHAYLYRRNKQQSLETWIRTLEPHIIHVHMNNSKGVIDEHLALNAPGGMVNYVPLLPSLTHLERDPWLILEIDDPVALEKSLIFMRGILGPW